MAACFESFSAVVRIEINNDQKSLKELSKNIATQKTAYYLQKMQVDSIRRRQNRMLEMISEILSHKEMLRMTYQNVAGFKKESRYYTAISRCALSIGNKSAAAFKALSEAEFAGKATAMIKLSSLIEDATGLGRCFVDIVANGKVSNPFKDDATPKKGDGHNLLNRHERLMMANSIILHLRKIERDLNYIIYIARSSGTSDLIRSLDWTTYCNALMSRMSMNQVLRQWENLTK